MSVWGELVGEHERALAGGYGEFKRTVNFQYGQWRVESYWDRKIMALGLRGCVGLGDWPPYEMFTRALWRYARRVDRLGVLELAEPELGNPMPVYLDGRLISQDLAWSCLDLNRMAQYIPLREKRNVLEIGAGCGRLAYAFKSLFPHCRYTIVDIEPARTLAKWYLAELGINIGFPRRVIGGVYDLVINTSSFDEMPPRESKRYLRLIDRNCFGHVFVSGMGRASHDRKRARLGLDELPWPARWKRIYEGRHPVLWPHRWVEKVFQV